MDKGCLAHCSTALGQGYLNRLEERTQLGRVRVCESVDAERWWIRKTLGRAGALAPTRPALLVAYWSIQTSIGLDAIPFATTSRTLGPDSCTRDTLKCVDTIASEATAMLLWSWVRQ
jgi:hypothetical protein